MYILIISHPNIEQPMKAVIMQVEIHNTLDEAEEAALAYFNGTHPEVDDLYVKTRWPNRHQSFQALLENVRLSQFFDIVTEYIDPQRLAKVQGDLP